ncbi:MAG TPA: 30S ribosomal protein S19 [Candidatus Nanoarchaeia archaeon]|nr:30S ribosomal protein S19 [Candidatus Nanoarchaeia archaeon]
MAKEFRWKGKTEEELKKMDLTTFAALIKSRKRRYLKRGFTPQQKIFLKKIERGENEIKTHNRDMIIIPSMLGKTIKVYNGKEFLPVLITMELLGHCLGEFSHTRKGVTHSAAGIGATRSSKSVSAR